MCVSPRDWVFFALCSVGLLLGGALVLHHDGRGTSGPFKNYWNPRAYSGQGKLWYRAAISFAVLLPFALFLVLPRLKGDC